VSYVFTTMLRGLITPNLTASCVYGRQTQPSANHEAARRRTLKKLRCIVTRIAGRRLPACSDASGVMY